MSITAVVRALSFWTDLQGGYGLSFPKLLRAAQKQGSAAAEPMVSAGAIAPWSR